MAVSSNMLESQSNVASASQANQKWRKWRSSHRGPLEVALKDPVGWNLYLEYIKSDPSNPLSDVGTFEEWTSRTSAYKAWMNWRRKHPGFLRNVLKDADGWNLFCKMKQEKGAQVYNSVKEWMQAQQRFAETRAKWVQLYLSNPGNLLETLEKEEAWRLFRASRHPDKKMPETFAEWRQCPNSATSQALEAWNCWRSVHRGPLETVLKDPEGFALYKAMRRSLDKSVVENYEDWVQGRMTGSTWLQWRKIHKGPLTEVLKDSDGWRLYKEHCKRTNKPCPNSHDEWIELPSRKLSAATAAWESWRREHSGPLEKILADPEGWALFQTLGELKQKNLPNIYSEWLSIILKKKRTKSNKNRSRYSSEDQMALTEHTEQNMSIVDEKKCYLSESSEGNGGQKYYISAWSEWRRNHPGPLQKILKYDGAWELYKSAQHAKDRECCETLEEWIADRQKWKASLVQTLNAWHKWNSERKMHIVEALKDINGWGLLNELIEKLGITFPEAYDEWLNNPFRYTAAAVDCAIKTRLRTSPRVMILQETIYALFRVVKEIEGVKTPNIYKKWRHAGNTIMDITGWKLWRRENKGALEDVLRDKNGWRLYKLQKFIEGYDLPDTYESWIEMPQQKKIFASNRWNLWRKQNPGMLCDVLKDDEGWNAYVAMRNAFGTEIKISKDEFIETTGKDYRDINMWKEWRKSHPGDLEFVLRDEDGWCLYKAACACRNRILPSNFEDFIRQRKAKAIWIQWKSQHKGKLVKVLSKFPEGWPLYRELLLSIGKECPQNFDEWVSKALPSSHKVKEWEKWKSQNPGVLVDVLKDLKGWLLYTEAMRSMGKKTDESYEKWIQGPECRKENAKEAYIEWRSTHKGPLKNVLMDPKGWELYLEMNISAGKYVPKTYEEWKNLGSRGESRTE